MSSIVVSGDTSGAVTLDAPTVAGTVTVTLPAASGTMVVTGSSPSLANVTATGNLSVSGNTTLGDASTDTVLMTGAPSIGGAGYGMGMGFRNRIINGAMMIDQRNAGASVTGNDGVYTLDRTFVIATQSSKFTVQQNAGAVTPPDGFRNYFGVTSSSAYSLLSSDHFTLCQRIEGFNTADMMFGTATAATFTLSFWVRSSLTGTFGGLLANHPADRCYLYSYTINAANTWEKKTITVAGDTTGTWATDNTRGLQVMFCLGAGSSYVGATGSWSSTYALGPTGQTNVLGTSGATFYITGVQLEKGSTATSFDYRPYGTELALCQRYCLALTSVYTGMGAGIWYSTTGAITTMQFPVAMRATPTLTTSSPNVGYLTPGGTLYSTNPTLNGGSTTNFEFYSVVGAGSSTAGYATVANLYSGKCFITAEL